MITPPEPILNLFVDEQDLTAEDLNRIVRRIRELEDLVRPAEIVSNEHRETTIQDYFGEGFYLLFRALPWMLCAATMGLLIVEYLTAWEIVQQGWLLGLWLLATLLGMLVLSVYIRYQYAHAAPRWELRERGVEQTVVLRRSSGLTAEFPLDSLVVRGSWLGTLCGVRWCRVPDFRAELRLLEWRGLRTTAPDAWRSWTESADATTVSVTLLLAVVQASTHTMRPDLSFLILLIVVQLVLLIAGRALAFIAAASNTSKD